MWEAKVIAADAATETNWKHKVTPDQGDLMMCNICKEIWNVVILNKHFFNAEQLAVSSEF